MIKLNWRIYAIAALVFVALTLTDSLLIVGLNTLLRGGSFVHWGSVALGYFVVIGALVWSLGWLFTVRGSL